MVGMENTSPFIAMQRMDTTLRPLLRDVELDSLEPVQRKAVKDIRRQFIDAKLDVRDYELSETRPEQLSNAVKAKNRLFKLQADILLAGNVFGPADVAQLSAQLEQING